MQLSDFPRPSVAVDLAVLSVRPAIDGGELVALVQHRVEDPCGAVLPGRFIREGETIADTVAAILGDKLGIAASRQPTPRLLRVFDAPDRDQRGWTISIGHSLALPWRDALLAEGEWRPVTARGGARGTKLLFDHPTILGEAVSSIRSRYEVDPDPERLLVGEFTLLDLRTVHEAVLGVALRKDTFSRRMREALVETGDSSTLRSLPASGAMTNGDILVSSSPSPRPGRPARLYRHPRRGSSNKPLWTLPREDS